MREIKFRAWVILGKKKNFIYFDLDEMREFDFDIFDEPPIFQQFTGLKDINGKDIYEGDIVKAYVPTRGKWGYRVGQVSYNSTDALYEVCSPEDIKYDNIGGYLINGGEEVLGNIYENPELLKDLNKNG